MKKLITVIGIILLCVPTVLAILLFKKPTDSPLDNPDLVTSVTVADFSQSVVYSAKETEEIAFFESLIKGDSVGSMPDAVRTFTQFYISFISGGSTDTYRFYMSKDMPDETYFENPEGALFKANALSARTFMEQKYAVSLYNTEIPALRVGNTQTLIVPSEMSWNYNHIGEGYYPIEAATSSETTNVDDITKMLGITFSVAPTSAVITVFEDDIPQVSRLLSDFMGITTQEAKYFKIKIEAAWSASDGADAYGSAVYTFKAYIRPDAVFALGAKTVIQGGVFEIAAKNALISTASIKCEPDMGVKPVFYNDGDTLRALIPTSFATAPGEYVLTVTNDDITSSYNVTVQAASFSAKKYTTKLETVNDILSQDNRTALQSIMTGLFSSRGEDAPLWGKETVITPTYKEVHKTGYGIEMNIEATGETFNHLGMDYDVAKGTDVVATFTGKIAYVGVNPIYGGIIVIDHGMGLRTWYCRVDTALVTVGQNVAQGDPIATTDDSGFGDSRRMHYAISINDTFISPLWLLENGFTLPNV